MTIKQEKFVQNLIQGMSQREAYKNSYNASRMKDSTIDNNAYKLLKNNEIATRYKELLEEVQKRDEEKAIMNAEERRKWLTEVINGTKKEIEVKMLGNIPISVEVDSDLSTKMKALDILNKMDGQYIEKRENIVTMNYEDKLKEVVDDDEY